MQIEVLPGVIACIEDTAVIRNIRTMRDGNTGFIIPYKIGVPTKLGEQRANLPGRVFSYILMCLLPIHRKGSD